MDYVTTNISHKNFWKQIKKPENMSKHCGDNADLQWVACLLTLEKNESFLDICAGSLLFACKLQNIAKRYLQVALQ